MLLAAAAQNYKQNRQFKKGAFFSESPRIFSELLNTKYIMEIVVRVIQNF